MRRKWYGLCAATAMALMVTGCQAKQTATASDAAVSETGVEAETEVTAESGSLANTGGTVVGTNYISSEKELAEIPLSSLGKIELSDYSSLNVTIPQISTEVTDSDLDDYVEAVLSSELRTVEGRGAQKGDTVTVDFVGLVDGKSFSGNQGSDYPIVLGSGQMLEDFENALYDAKTGDKVKATVTFPDDYTSTEVAGKTAQFEITVKNVQEPSELNEDFIKAHTKTGSTTEDEYREELRSELQTWYEKRIDFNIFTTAINQLVETSTLEPSSAFADWVYRKLEKNRSEYIQNLNMSLEDYKSATGLDDTGLENEIWTQVNNNIGPMMVLRQIAADQNLDDPENLKEKLVIFTRDSYGIEITEDQLEQRYGDDTSLMELEAAVYDYMGDKIQVTYQDTTETQN